MVVTNNDAYAEKLRFLTTQAKDDLVKYIHSEIGYNYRLTNIQAAMGVAQLEKLEDYIQAKRNIARRYSEALAEVDGIVPMRQAEWAESIYWLFSVLVEPDEFGISNMELLSYLGEKKIQARPLWQPMHVSKAHSKAGNYRIEVADEIYRRSLSLPCSVGLSLDKVDQVAQHIKAARSATA